MSKSTRKKHEVKSIVPVEQSPQEMSERTQRQVKIAARTEFALEMVGILHEALKTFPRAELIQSIHDCLRNEPLKTLAELSKHVPKYVSEALDGAGDGQKKATVNITFNGLNVPQEPDFIQYNPN